MQFLPMNIFDVDFWQRYLICNPLPKTTEEIENVTDMMYRRMVDREDEAIQKLRQVIDFATGDDCERLCSSDLHDLIENTWP
jgi:hypothetical protein